MPARLNTIIIVPHSKARFLKFSFSSRAAVAASIAGGLALVLSIVAIVYTGSAVNRRIEVARLESENRELASVNQELERTIAEVQGRLDEFEERTARLALATGVGPAEGGISGGGSASSRAGAGGPYDRLPESPQALQARGRWLEEQLDLVEGQVDEQLRILAATPTIAPARGLITDGFGRRQDPLTGRLAFHEGLDIAGRRGSKVKAPADGIVVFAGPNGGLGRTVRIAHDFGFTTVYGHLDKISVQPGDEVQRGQEVGLLGNSGRSTGPHLHYEVHLEGRAVDPLYYVLDAF